MVSSGRMERRAESMSFGTQLAAEHLDIAATIAKQGIAIGSPILFKHELASGCLVPAHDLVASDGRAFWLVYPVSRQNSRKVTKLREWLCDEAAMDRAEARTYINNAVGQQR